MKINQKRIDKIGKDLDRKYLEKFVQDVQILGLENLKKLKGKQIFYLPNHLSLFDFIVIPKILNDFNLKHPAIIAGSNLNRWPFNKIIQEETGAIFIDRKIMKKKRISEKKRKEILKLNSKLEEVVSEKHNLINFVESGRSYSGKIMERGDSGILKRYLINSKKYEKKTYGCNIAIKYEPFPIESSCLHLASFFKNKIETIYFFVDVYSFIKNYFLKAEKKPLVKVNFGEPYSLEKFIKKRNPGEFLEFIKKDVKKLYREIEKT